MTAGHEKLSHKGHLPDLKIHLPQMKKIKMLVFFLESMHHYNLKDYHCMILAWGGEEKKKRKKSCCFFHDSS